MSLLRSFITEMLKTTAGSQPEETYSKLLADDECFDVESVAVPNKTKRLVKDWMRAMGLSPSKRSS
jgi:hypothetical protein